MQPAPNVEQQTTTEVLIELLSLMGKADQTWVDLLAEDAVVEFPYSSSTPGRLEGKEAIYNYIKDALFQMQDLMFTNIRVYPTTNPNILWAEFRGEAVIVSTGRHYQQDYVIRLETREGKIIHYRGIAEIVMLDVAQWTNEMSSIKSTQIAKNGHRRGRQ